MTFEEWFSEYDRQWGLHPPAYYVARDAWQAAIASTITKPNPLSEEQIDDLFPFKGYKYVGPEEC